MFTALTFGLPCNALLNPHNEVTFILSLCNDSDGMANFSIRGAECIRVS
jgi:hypothetical protein